MQLKPVLIGTLNVIVSEHNIIGSGVVRVDQLPGYQVGLQDSGKRESTHSTTTVIMIARAQPSRLSGLMPRGWAWAWLRLY